MSNATASTTPTEAGRPLPPANPEPPADPHVAAALRAQVYTAMVTSIEHLRGTDQYETLIAAFLQTCMDPALPLPTPVCRHPFKGETKKTQLSSVQVGTIKAAQDVTLIRKRVESSDFTIVSCGEKIPVHTLVLRTYWEYFDVLMRNDCLETKTNMLELEYPLEWVQNLVSYLYGEKLHVPMDILTALMMLGSLYQLPDLVKATETEILLFAHTAVSFQDIIIGWQRAVQTGNDTVKDHLLKCVVEKCRSAKPKHDVLKEWLEPLSKYEATEFLAEFMSHY